MSEVIVISDDEQDEQGVVYRPNLSSPIPPARFLGDSRSSESSGKAGLNVKIGPPGQKKRRRPSESEPVKDVSNVKKAKREERKALTIVINSQKVQAVAAQHRWIHHHKHSFIPLVGPKSHFFTNLETEMKGLGPEKRATAPFEEIEKQPKLIKGGQMKDYQLHGLSFLAWMHKNGMNSILGDEMGLGKTLQTLSLLAYVKEQSHGAGSDPHLIICPLSVLSSWLNETARWVPSFRALRFHGQASERARLKNNIRDGGLIDVCITTYDSFVAEHGWFKSKRWNYCVLDEGHKIKNSGTAIASKLQGIGASRRLILTGTPVHNNLGELWGLLHWLYPNVFTAATQNLFQESFDLSKGTYSIPFLTAAKKLLEKIMLRRTKANVETTVPPREELTVFIPLTEAQRFWTYRLLTRMDTMDLKSIFISKIEADSDDVLDHGRRQVQEMLKEQIGAKEAKPAAWKRLMNLLLQLRMVCDHPYMLQDAEPSPYTIGEHLVASSSKLVVIDKILADILPKGERVLIFSQWTSMLDLLEDFMGLRKIPYARLDGSTSRPRRNLDIRLFQQEKSPYKVFLISTKAGGLGINLTKATTVIMVDSDWNPQNDLQAIARAHRIGQTKTVKVYRLICGGSVEDQMLDRIRRKLFLSLKVIGSTEVAPSEDSSLGKAELLDILRRGSSALSADGDQLPLAKFLKAPIEDILEISRKMDKVKETKIKSELPAAQADEVKAESDTDEVDQRALRDVEEEEMRLLKGIALVQSRLFEGKVVQRGTANKDIAKAWEDVQQRAKVDRLVMVDGIQVVAEYIGPIATSEEKPVKKEKGKPRFEHEDWCNSCRDGGELVMCHVCPRVFHPECYGYSKAQVSRSPMMTCSQHKCHLCFRTTGDAGGMLFRCQTCPQAFCEDCLPEDDIDAIGDTLPEFLLLGFRSTSSMYFIRCHGCQNDFAEDPARWESWQQEFAETEEKLRLTLNLGS